MSSTGSERVNQLLIPYRRLFGDGIPLPVIIPDTGYIDVINRIRTQKLFTPPKPRTPEAILVDDEIAANKNNLLNSRE